MTLESTRKVARVNERLSVNPAHLDPLGWFLSMPASWHERVQGRSLREREGWREGERERGRGRERESD